MKSNDKEKFGINIEEKRYHKLKALIADFLEENHVNMYETVHIFSSLMGFMRSRLGKEERDTFDNKLGEVISHYYSFFSNMQKD